VLAVYDFLYLSSVLASAVQIIVIEWKADTGRQVIAMIVLVTQVNVAHHHHHHHHHHHRRRRRRCRRRRICCGNCSNCKEYSRLLEN
jgi:hypothetical protein